MDLNSVERVEEVSDLRHQRLAIFVIPPSIAYRVMAPSSHSQLLVLEPASRTTCHYRIEPTTGLLAVYEQRDVDPR